MAKADSVHSTLRRTAFKIVAGTDFDAQRASEAGAPIHCAIEALIGKAVQS
jgi:hypothetical protein